MIITVSIEVKRGLTYARRVNIYDTVIVDHHNLSGYLTNELRDISADVVDHVVQVLRPETTAQIFNKTMADHQKSCCDNEQRTIQGGCRNCGDPSY